MQKLSTIEFVKCFYLLHEQIILLPKQKVWNGLKF